MSAPRIHTGGRAPISKRPELRCGVFLQPLTVLGRIESGVDHSALIIVSRVPVLEPTGLPRGLPSISVQFFDPSPLAAFVALSAAGFRVSGVGSARFLPILLRTGPGSI